MHEFHTFIDGESATGFVRFAQGFAATGNVALDILFPIDGPITMGDDSVITLNNNLTLEPDVTFSNGVTFSSDKMHTIFLKGNLIIPEGKILKITEDMIIDGQGHQIKFEEDAQCIIDGPEETKVRFRNITLKGLQNNDKGVGTIHFGKKANQTLTLDNVDVLLSGDFTFDGGILRIKNMVSIKGEYLIFQFRAPYDCRILGDSTLFIDLITGFYYNPSDGKRNHIYFKDITSQLFLNGCFMYVSGLVGCILKRGHLVVDYNVVFSNGFTTDSDHGFIFGNGKAESDLEIDIYPGASIDVSHGFLSYRNTF